MPTLEALETLKTQINELGDEPRLLAERGESMVDVTPPEAPSDPDLERMLDEDTEGGADAMEALLESYAEDLDDVPNPNQAPEGEDAGLGGDLIDDLDFGADAFGDLAPPDDAADGFDGLEDLLGGNEDLSEEPVAESELASLGDETPDLEPEIIDGEADDFGGLDDLLGDLVEEEEPLPGDIGSIDAAPVSDEQTFDADDLLGDLDIGDVSEETPPLDESGFDLPDIEEPAAVEDAMNDILDTSAADTDAGFDDIEAPGEDFDLPSDDSGFSLDDLDLGDTDEPLDDFGAPPAETEPDQDAETPVDGVVDSLDDLDGLDDLDDLADLGEEFSEDAGIDLGEMDDLGGMDDLAASGPLDDSDVTADAEEFSAEDDFGDLETLDDLSDDDLGNALDGADDESSEDDGFSLDDLDLGADETAGDTALEGDLAELGDEEDGLEDLGGLDDLGDFDSEIPEAGDYIPDVDAAVSDLGDLDDLDSDSADELSLDDDLNFDEELGADVLSDIREVGDESQQFSMDDFGEQYNFKEGETGFADNLGVDLEQLEQSLDDASEGEAKPFSLEDVDFEALLQTLATLPRNLKVAIEGLLADENRNIEDLKPLIDGLIDGESPKSLASRFRAITKRKIELPRTYEKRSGRLLEEKRAALAYRLVREGWPVIRTVLLIIAIAWVTVAALFMWVYRPLKAEQLYNAGLDAIAVDDIDQAVEYFYDAWDGWPLFSSGEGEERIGDAPIVVKGWKDDGRWLDYAQALRRRKHWDKSEAFYDGYLSYKPEDKAVRLEYSTFLSDILGKYEKAVSVLENAPVRGRGSPDRDYMLAVGDVYLRWGEDDPTKYEEARYRYAKVLETSRNDERAILSMMRYHLHLADEEEIKTLLPIFKNEVPGKTSEPELAAEVFAGLGDFHLVRGADLEARRFIDLALAADPLAPEPSYVDARFWRSRGDDERELRAHKRTLVNLDGKESLGRADLKMNILTLGGMGRLYSNRAMNLAGDPAALESRSLATNFYTKALDLYEDAQARNQLGASPEYGRLYLEIGDMYYQGESGGGDLGFKLVRTPESLTPDSDRYAELVQAESSYTQAESLFNRGDGKSSLPTETLYRRAYARHELGMEGALVDFHRVVRREPQDYEARMALGVMLLESGDYEASRNQYARALELLDDEVRRTGGVLDPFLRQSHEGLLVRYAVAWNNLGVGRARSAARGGGEEDYAAALSAFTMSSEYLDEVYTDMTGVMSMGAMGLRDLEERRVMEISEEDGRNFLKEKATYPYRNRLRLLGLETAEDFEDQYLMYSDIPSDLARE